MTLVEEELLIGKGMSALQEGGQEAIVQEDQGGDKDPLAIYQLKHCFFEYPSLLNAFPLFM